MAGLPLAELQGFLVTAKLGWKEDHQKWLLTFCVAQEKTDCCGKEEKPCAMKRMWRRNSACDKGAVPCNATDDVEPMEVDSPQDEEEPVKTCTTTDNMAQHQCARTPCWAATSVVPQEHLNYSISAAWPPCAEAAGRGHPQISCRFVCKFS